MEAVQFFKQRLAKEVWEQTYKWETDIVIQDTFKREAGAFASNEEKPEVWEPQFYDVLANLRYVPGGRIISNAGTNLTGTSWINCFVSGFKGVDRDSIKGIYAELTRQARILKSEGGYGFCVNTLRPYGAYIKGIGSESPGAVSMLDLWDTSSAVITSGTSAKKNKGKGKNKIRKGAMMVTMSVWHPDIEDYIVSKQRPGKLSKFNMSVLVHDSFMEAVANHTSWDLEFPITDFDKYAEEWDGNIYTWKSKGYPTKVYKTFEDANELWDLITTSTYNRNEPGIIFIDRVNHLNNLYYCEEISATNPCGEQPLPPDASCNLGAINLTQYILGDGSDFDYEKLKKDIPVILRMQDSVNDLTYFPLEEQKEQAQQKRRVGIGYMGYGSALYLLKKIYGSEEALIKTAEICSFVTNQLYQASALLAKEKGSFPAFDKEKYLKSNFVVQALTAETFELIAKHGLRNSHITTVAPTGNTGIFANLVSGGLEPVISHLYTRTLMVPEMPTGLEVPININWDLDSCENQGIWLWVKEGDESLLRTVYQETTYKIDRSRGLTKEEEVYDYAVLEMGEDFWKDKAEYEKNGKEFYGKTIFDLKVEDHLTTMAVFAKYIDSAISKTINVPQDYPYDEFKGVYTKAFETGTIKGITTYRWGTMANVVSAKSETKEKTEVDERPKAVIVNHAPKRPKTLPCDVYNIQIKGEKWNVFIGKLDGYPFEVFAGKQTIKLPEKGTITKAKSKTYVFDSEGVVDSLNLLETYGEHGSYVYSKMLQHGVPLWSIIDMCDKMLENVLGFNKAMGRIVKKYIKTDDVKFLKCGECGSSAMVFQESCILCRDCGQSKCS
jgi:ribonucleoside-diphosphate reductase alpha chain